jgi:hypothetical protein
MMSCSICGRGSCTKSFHSIEEQEKHDKYADMSEDRLIRECVDLSDEVSNLSDSIESLSSENERLRQVIMRLGLMHPSKYQHNCLEWDGLQIDEFCPEFESCTCFK